MAPPKPKMEAINILIHGDRRVGKQSFYARVVFDHWVEEWSYDPTGEDYARKQMLLDGETSMISFTKQVGEPEFVAMREGIIRDSDAYVLLYSVTSRQSLGDIEARVEEIKRVWGRKSASPPIMCLVGNKIDDVEGRVVSSQEGEDLAKKLGCRFFEISPKENIGCHEPVHYIIREHRKRKTEDGGRGRQADSAVVKKRGWKGLLRKVMGRSNSPLR